MKTREFLFGLVTIAAMVAALAAKTENHTVYVEDEMSRTVPGFATLIAHRGESVDAPENSLPAYRLACSRGFGFECDVYLSSDKRVPQLVHSSGAAGRDQKRHGLFGGVLGERDFKARHHRREGNGEIP